MFCPSHEPHQYPTQLAFYSLNSVAVAMAVSGRDYRLHIQTIDFAIRSLIDLNGLAPLMVAILESYCYYLQLCAPLRPISDLHLQCA